MKTPKKFEDQELLDILINYYNTKKKNPTAAVFSHSGLYPTANIYARHFGSWTKALEAAGIPVRDNIKKRKTSNFNNNYSL